MPETPTGQALWQKAATYAATLHRHHTRKGSNGYDADAKTPYIAHPFRVALTIRNIFNCDDPVVLAAALLHDTIEDTEADYDDLHEHFGPEVADLVAALTKDQRMPEREREQAYHDQLAAAPWRARLIKLADVYDNVTDSSCLPEAKQRKAVDKAKLAISMSENDPQLAPAVACVKALIDSRIC